MYAHEEEACVVQIRLRLRRRVQACRPGTWGFALYPRRKLDARMLSLRLMGFVTLSDSGALTSALLVALPQDVWLEWSPTPIQLISVAHEPELLHEPLPGVLLRRRDDDLSRTQSLSAHSLPPLGIVFLTRGAGRPPGWPT